jgi:hypothetical protein
VDKHLYSESFENVINLAPDTFKEAATANFVTKDFSNNDDNNILLVEYSIGTQCGENGDQVSLQPGYLRQTLSMGVPIAVLGMSHGLKVVTVGEKMKGSKLVTIYHKYCLLLSCSWFHRNCLTH